MGRPKGVGMTRAKKKKPKQQQEACPAQSEPAPAGDMPPPPPSSPQPSARRSVLPASPGLEARREANLALREALKRLKVAAKLERRETILVGEVWGLQGEVYDKVEKAQRKKARKWQWEEKLLHRAEEMLQKQCYLQTIAQVDRAEAERDVARA